MSTPFFTPDRQTAAASRITEFARLQDIARWCAGATLNYAHHAPPTWPTRTLRSSPSTRPAAGRVCGPGPTVR